MQELKIRIDSIPDIEERILRIGGHKGKQAIYKYTYFNQPKDSVLKITKKPEGVFKTVIRVRNNKFEIISSDPIEDEDEITRELTTKFGIKKKLVNHRIFFSLNGDELSINNIEGVGKILIIKAIHPSLDIAKKLNINNPDIVATSFDNL